MKIALQTMRTNIPRPPPQAARSLRASWDYRPAHNGYEIVWDRSARFLYSITGIAPVQAFGLISRNANAAWNRVKVEKRSILNLIQRDDGYALYYGIEQLTLPGAFARFYFRARHDAWRFTVEGTDFCSEGPYGKGGITLEDLQQAAAGVLSHEALLKKAQFAASDMPFSMAEKLIRIGVSDFLRG